MSKGEWQEDEDATASDEGTDLEAQNENADDESWDITTHDVAASGPEVCAECGATANVMETQIRRRSPHIVEVLECGHRVNRD